MTDLLAILFPCLVAFAATSVALHALIGAAPRLGLLDRPGGRKRQPAAVPTVGGLALLAGWLAASGAGSIGQAGVGFLVPWLGLFLVGWVDDRTGKRMGAGLKTITTLACLVACWLLQPERGSALLLIPAFVLLHSFNTSDNMNGLAGGFGLSGCVALIVLTLAGELPGASAGGSAALLGGLVAFLSLNYPGGRVFLGDSGSLLIGGWFACTLLKQQHPALLMLAAVPIADLVTVAALRCREGRVPWQGDRSHVSHRLARNGGGETVAVALLWTAQLPWTLATIFLLATPNAGPGAWTWTLLALTGACGLILFLGSASWPWRRALLPESRDFVTRQGTGAQAHR